MPVKMKKEIRKRIACMVGTTQKAIRRSKKRNAMDERSCITQKVR